MQSTYDLMKGSNLAEKREWVATLSASQKCLLMSSLNERSDALERDRVEIKALFSKALDEIAEEEYEVAEIQTALRLNSRNQS
jgi:hypothetical protein